MRENIFPFWNIFKYLGTYVSDTLKKDLEIHTMISKAQNVLGAKKHICKGNGIYHRAKAQHGMSQKWKNKKKASERPSATSQLLTIKSKGESGITVGK